ncbi:MAG: FG-GAP repeat domain-containing protein, partial [Planctomycetota bacterium]
ALRAFAEAARLAPDQAVPRYEQFQASKLSALEAEVAAGRNALAEAYRIDPSNLFIALDWLEVAAESRDAGFAAAVHHFLKTLRPLLPGLKRRTRIDVEPFVNQAVELAAQGQWPQAAGIVRRLGFVRAEDVAQSDYRRILPNPLELVLQEFREARCDPPTLTATPNIPIQFGTRRLAAAGAMNRVGDLRVVDFDLDGRLDIVWLNEGRLTVFSQAAPIENSPTTWKSAFSFPIEPGFHRLLAADLDRDDKGADRPPPRDFELFFQADADLVLYGPAGLRVYRNRLDPANGERRLEVVEQAESLAAAREVTAATLADFDHDGDLDLALAAASGIGLWINRGNLTFDDVSASSNLPPPDVAMAGLQAVDWDRDIDADILVADASGKAVGFLENLRHIEFRWRPLDKPFEALRGAASLAVFEGDGNVSWDLLASGPNGLKTLLTATPVPGAIQAKRSQTVTDTPCRGAMTLDFDNDAFVDAVAWGDQLRLYRGGPEGQFSATETTLFGDQSPRDVLACEPADLDGDGDEDLAVASADGLFMLENQGGNQNPWIDVVVRGLDESISGRVNHFAIGSWVEIKSGGRYQASLVTRPVSHFGLGPVSKPALDTVGKSQPGESAPVVPGPPVSAANGPTAPPVEIVRVLFTNGVPQSVIAPAANQVVRESQALKGSCPYLYVWNGERFDFYTDLLWAAPLGLQIADGVILRDRPWEFLKIDGETLRPKDDRYELRVTEELWEAGYFDQVELIAIDHPAEVAVYSNEKVGPPTLAARKIHTARRPRTPIAARDQTGRDVLELVSKRDERYAQCYDRTLRQGLAEPHFLELDLGPLGNPRSLTLFLTGWIYPTDTSLNVGLSQNPVLDGPRPPSLWVPDGADGWREAIGFTGFPGGKTKTIAIDLTGVLTAGDGRLRIMTTAELRWDEAFFTVDEGPAEVRETRLGLVSAELRYRGFSQAIPRRSPASPDRYDYGRSDPAPKWAPMRGRFTRYGDVRELLETWDDRMVVMGAGDEMALVFDAGPPIPNGWRRDFLMHNVGWDKDADIHTVYGQTVEPLPYREMDSYPYASALERPAAGNSRGPARSDQAVDDPYAADPKLADYLRRYQIREQPPHLFWRRLQP